MVGALMMGSFLFYTTPFQASQEQVLGRVLATPLSLGWDDNEVHTEAPVGIELQVPDNHPALTSFPLSLLHFSTCVS